MTTHFPDYRQSDKGHLVLYHLFITYIFIIYVYLQKRKKKYKAKNKQTKKKKLPKILKKNQKQSNKNLTKQITKQNRKGNILQFGSRHDTCTVYVSRSVNGIDTFDRNRLINRCCVA